jgi:glutathione reductase (NADPH)
MTDEYDVDLLVIGGGSGGVRAARVAANHGAKVLLAEESRLGGTCVIRGCVPKKLFVYASRFRKLFDTAAEFGWAEPETHFDWPRLVETKDRETARLEDLYLQSQLLAGVEVVKSRAVLEGPHNVRLTSDGRLVRAGIILVAAGATPVIPEIPGVEYAITSNEVFDLEEFPKRLVVIGAGYIAIEIAGLFASLGSEVSVVCRADDVLTGFDQDLREGLAAAYLARGIKLHFTDAVMQIVKNEQSHGFTVSTRKGTKIEADQVLSAVGRMPKTDGLGLEKAGVAVSALGAIIVNGESRTNVPSIYAVGDVTHRIELTPVAIREGHAFADRVFGNKPWEVDYCLIPTALFSTPEIGTVGLTEAEARVKYDVVEVYKTRFRSLMESAAGTFNYSLMKVVVDQKTQRILGIHLFAESASEMIQFIAVALRAGATMQQFTNTMAVHPTLGEELVTMRVPFATYRRSADALPPKVVNMVREESPSLAESEIVAKRTR